MCVFVCILLCGGVCGVVCSLCLCAYFKVFVCFVCGLLCDGVWFAVDACCFVVVCFLEHACALCVIYCVVLQMCF